MSYLWVRHVGYRAVSWSVLVRTLHWHYEQDDYREAMLFARNRGPVRPRSGLAP